jgi:site-specific DNA-cytosine methylase
LPDRFFWCRMTDHSTTYARLRQNFPAYTITALFGNITAGAFTHPLQNRALSIREGARLQSFPDDVVFEGPRNSQYRQIGNAVPPLLAKRVGRHIRDLLEGKQVESRPPRITPSVLADSAA